MSLQFDNGKFVLPEEYVLALEKGAQFESLAGSTAYKLLLDGLEYRANQALRTLRGAALSSDERLKSNLLLKYECAEEALRDVQIMVQEAVAERHRIISELGSQLTELDVMDFGR